MTSYPSSGDHPSVPHLGRRSRPRPSLAKRVARRRSPTHAHLAVAARLRHRLARLIL
ncbi:hypothetical protein [Nocardioides sp. CER19]|uniref:hypothetical protein n=1 Tax=Nocardioides sp. CER19 TaxID=3038538 RepID=UPI00244BCEEB|nr:hypothetical protein [Nocardioides sp. CER19]MDH2416520.1 hypothetical protein [Nocardioides sp. CER19]